VVFPAGTREVFHTSKVIGHAGTVQAVHCADLLTNEGPDPDEGLEVWVQNEVYCQRITAPDKGATTACSGIHERVGYGVPSSTFAQPQQICGKLFKHSPCTGGRDEHSFLATFVTPTSSRTCSIWAESGHDSVVLPTAAHPTVSAAVVATPHFTYHIEAGETCIEIPL
jgi:hypothetical protein